MRWRRKALDPARAFDPIPVDRYSIVVTYPTGGIFTLNISGPQSWDPTGHVPAHLAECIADGLRRGMYDVKLQEERTVIT